MSRVTSNQKFFRMIKFLRSVKSRRVGRIMAKLGFDNDEYRRGWELFHQAMGSDLPDAPRAALTDGPSRELLERIDRWENMAFDVVDATLRSRYPALHERVLRNLAKTHGPEVIFTVGTLLRRLDELEQEGGAEIEEALELLAKRRITPQARRHMQTLIDQATNLSATDLDASPEEREAEEQRRRDEKERARAEEAMWTWFKDWAQIARTAVTDKRIRFYMGISQRSHASGSTNDAPEHEATVEPMPTPNPTEPAVPASA